MNGVGGMWAEVSRVIAKIPLWGVSNRSGYHGRQEMKEILFCQSYKHIFFSYVNKHTYNLF